MRLSFLLWIGVGVVVLVGLYFFFFSNPMWKNSTPGPLIVPPSPLDKLVEEAEKQAWTSFERYWQKCGDIYQSRYSNPVKKETAIMRLGQTPILVKTVQFPSIPVRVPEDGQVTTNWIEWQGRVEFSTEQASRYPIQADGLGVVEPIFFGVTKDTKPIPFWTVTLSKDYEGEWGGSVAVHPSLVGIIRRDDSGNEILVLPEYFTPEPCDTSLPDMVNYLQEKNMMTITTNKTDYLTGEKVQITFQNASAGAVRFGNGNLPFSVQRLGISGWEPVRVLDNPCADGLIPPAPVAFSIKGNGSEILEWDQKESWCDATAEPPSAVEEYVQMGTYRIVTQSWEEGGSGQQVIYSNEFLAGNSVI